MLADVVATPLGALLLAIWGLFAAGGGYRYALRIAEIGPAIDDDAVRRVARNSLIPIASQLVIRGSDLAVAIVLLRLLGPEGNGRYALAVVVWLYVKTISDFGLSLLATGDIARDRSLAGRMVGETTLLRLIVLAASVVPVAGYIGAGRASGTLTTESVVAIALLYCSIIPSSYAEAVNSALNGFEQMAVGAWLNVAVGLARAPLVILFAARFGVEGVALAALLAAGLSADLYRRAAARTGVGDVVWSLDRNRGLALARRSWPLLVNALLVNLFFRVDVFIVQALKGDEALGVYDASYKLINLVTIVPAYVTLAIFPAMAQRAGDPAALERTLRSASYILVWLAWGIVAGVSAVGESTIRVLAGQEYLPESATLLRILIWFAPLSFLNGVIQYALVASERQRRIVPAFAAAVVSNLALNLAFVPAHGARAAAGATIATELVILIAFAILTRGSSVPAMTRTSIYRLARPTVAGVAAAAVAMVAAGRFGELVAAPLAALTFIGLSAAVGVAGPSERELLRRALRRSPVHT